MIKIPLSTIRQKILKTAKISDSELDTKIEQKMEQLSGLISKEGAAHIVANELGVDLYENMLGKLKITNLLAGMRNVETVGKVQRKFDVREFAVNGRQGKVGSIVIGDETGTIRLVLWNDQTKNLENLKEGDIVKIANAYVRDNNGRKEVHLNDRSKFIINPEGEAITEVKQYSTTRKRIADLGENETDIELLGVIVQLFEPRFFEVCPLCNKRAKQQDGSFVCAEHNAVTPDYSYVLNAVLDDGTDTIRLVCFRNQAERLLKKTTEQMRDYRLNPQNFASIKNEMLGETVKVVGKSSKNTMFDRMEFVTRLVFTDINPEEEVKRLKKELEDSDNEKKTEN